MESILDIDPSQLDMAMLEQLKAELEQLTMVAAENPEAQEQLQMLAAELAAVEQEQRRRLDRLTQMLSQEFEKAIRAKQDAESRMIADDRQWDGQTREWGDSKAYPNDSQATSLLDDQSNVVHATRSRQMLYSARLVDMMLPTNEIPFRVDPDENADPTCIPTFAPPPPQQDEAGNPIEPSQEDVLGAVDDANNRAASKMQDTIKDQLYEAGLQRHGRRMIDDATRIGVGILRGPFMQYKRKVKVRQVNGSPEPQVEMVSMTVPGLDYVNPYMFWYDMAPCLSKSRKTFEAELYDRARLMELKKYPETIHSAIDELLAEKDPSIPAALSASINRRNQALGLIEPLTGRWAVIRTYMAIEAEKLRDIAGIEWPHEDVMPLIEMLWCNGKCLKWKLAELDCSYRLPYYAFTPFPLDDTIFGASVSYLARTSQSNLDGAWRATLTNAALSSGPQLFMKKGAFSPQDGAWRTLGPKIWDWTDEGVGDIRAAMQSLLLTSNVQENLELTKQCLDFMDQDTLLSQILQGNITEASQGPAAALVQLINLSTIIQRTLAARADDGVWQPLAEAWGLWNSLYNPDPSIKGDFNYKGIASTALVSRDVQTQHLQVLTQMSADPRFAGFTDNYALWSSNIKILDIPDKDSIALPRDKAMANQAAMQQAQPDPMLEAKMAEIELGRQKLETDAQLRMQEMQLEQQRIAAEQQARADELAIKFQIAQLDYQRALVDAASKREIDIAKLDAETDKAVASDATQRVTKGAEIAQKAAADQAKIDLAAQKMAQDADRIALAKNPSPDSALD